MTYRQKIVDKDDAMRIDKQKKQEHVFLCMILKTILSKYNIYLYRCVILSNIYVNVNLLQNLVV